MTTPLCAPKSRLIVPHLNALAPSYICLRQTTTVLATIDVLDFLYACENHLTDPGFASPLPSEPVKPQVSAEEIARIKKEYEEKQKAKKDKEKADKEKEAKDGKEEKEKAKSPTPADTPASPSPSTPTTHQRYALHRQVYQMRCDDHRKRRNAKQAREVAPKLPIAPRGAPT